MLYANNIHEKGRQAYIRVLTCKNTSPIGHIVMHYPVETTSFWRNSSNSGDRQWKHIFQHNGWVQKLTITKENFSKLILFRRSCRNYKREKTPFEYDISDSMSEFNITCVIFVKYWAFWSNIVSRSHVLPQSEYHCWLSTLKIENDGNAHYLWWPTLSPLLWSQGWVQMGLSNSRILLE